jgi:hypothetical protein
MTAENNSSLHAFYHTARVTMASPMGAKELTDDRR